MFSFISDFLAFRAERRKIKADARECEAIARRFNNRYTHRLVYDSNAPVDQSRAWMCPKCNKVHLSYEHSFLSGMQYPACCDHPRGHRQFDGIAH